MFECIDVVVREYVHCAQNIESPNIMSGDTAQRRSVVCKLQEVNALIKPSKVTHLLSVSLLSVLNPSLLLCQLFANCIFIGIE